MNLRIALRDIDLIMESLDEQGRGLVDYEELTLRILKSKVDAIDDSYTRSSPSPSSKSSRSRNLVTITFSKRPDLKEDVLHAVKVASATKRYKLIRMFF